MAPAGRDDEPTVAEVIAWSLQWGPYLPAIVRWSHVTGRPAPPPTEPGRTGERLSPAFVEWMQGVPDGWVTGVPGLSRNAQLKALGNGVVWQQAAMAVRLLLDRAGFRWLERAA
jgi:DNA (cytosine-5)-methyltransferase 1